MKENVKAIQDALARQVEAIDKLKPRTQSVDDACIKVKACIRLLGNVETEAADIADFEKMQAARREVFKG